MRGLENLDKEVIKKISEILEIQSDLLKELAKLVEKLNFDEIKDNRKKFYSVKEAANLMSVSESTIRRWIAEGLIEHTKIGGKILIPAEIIPSLMKGSKFYNRF